MHFQVLVDGTNSPAYATINVGEGATETAVAKDIAFDSSKQHMYALTGNRVSTVKLLIYVTQMMPNHKIIPKSERESENIFVTLSKSDGLHFR